MESRDDEDYANHFSHQRDQRLEGEDFTQGCSGLGEGNVASVRLVFLAF